MMLEPLKLSFEMLLSLTVESKNEKKSSNYGSNLFMVLLSYCPVNHKIMSETRQSDNIQMSRENQGN